MKQLVMNVAGTGDSLDKRKTLLIGGFSLA
jgi:hypothetical protein